MSPTVSFGICTSNDVGTIGILASSLLRISDRINQDGYPFTISQIIIISSGSLDGTNSVIQEVQQKFDQKERIVAVIELKRYGKADAINKIMAINSSSYLILLPADVLVTEKSIISLMNNIIGDTKTGIVTGKPVPNIRSNFNLLQKAVTFMWKLHNETLKYTSSHDINSHSSGELMVIRSEIFPHLPINIVNDDAYMAIIAKQKGYKVGYEENAVVLINVPTTLRDYYVQRERVLYGHDQLASKVNQKPSNFRTLLVERPSCALRILRNTIRSGNTLIGFLYASLLEFRTELGRRLKPAGRTSDADQSKIPVWKRISQTHFSDFSLISD